MVLPAQNGHRSALRKCPASVGICSTRKCRLLKMHQKKRVNRAEKPTHEVAGLNAPMGIMFGGVCSTVGIQGQAGGQPRMGGGRHRGSPCVGANFLFLKYFCGERSCTPSYNQPFPGCRQKCPTLSAVTLFSWPSECSGFSFKHRLGACSKLPVSL